MSVKPIIIQFVGGDKTLTNVMSEVERDCNLPEPERNNTYWILHNHFHSVVNRLRLEVKRHKKTKKTMSTILSARQTLAEMTCNEVDTALGEGYRRPDESLSEAVTRLKSNHASVMEQLQEANEKLHRIGQLD